MSADQPRCRTQPLAIEVGDVIEYSASGSVHTGTVTELGRHRHVKVDTSNVVIPPNWIIGKVTQAELDRG